MANHFHANPLRCDTASTVINKNCYIQGLEWISDDSAQKPLADGSTLLMTLNGVAINLLVTPLPLTQPWTIQFYQPLQVGSLIVSEITAGALLVWMA